MDTTSGHLSFQTKWVTRCTSQVLTTGRISLKAVSGASLVVQWLRIYLPVPGTWVQSLVRELRSYIPQGSQARVPELLSPLSLEPVLCNKRTPHATKTQSNQEINFFLKRLFLGYDLCLGLQMSTFSWY